MVGFKAMTKNKKARVFFAHWLFHRTGFTPDDAEYKDALKPFLKGKLMVLRVNESEQRCQMFCLEKKKVDNSGEI